MAHSYLLHLQPVGVPVATDPAPSGTWGRFTLPACEPGSVLWLIEANLALVGRRLPRLHPQV
jgi:hypothetical protein